jgi:hypothetical protein
MMSADPGLPGYRPLEGLVLVIAFFACCFGIPALLGDSIGFVLSAILGFVVSVIALSLISGLFLKRKRAAEGLVPDEPGQAGQVALLARKFRERASQIEQAVQWGKERVPDPGWQTWKLFKDVRAMTRAADLHFLRGFDFAVPDEQYAKSAGGNDDLRAALETRMHQLRSRADQLDAFAEQLRGEQKKG